MKRFFRPYLMIFFSIAVIFTLKSAHAQGNEAPYNSLPSLVAEREDKVSPSLIMLSSPQEDAWLMTMYPTFTMLATNRFPVKTLTDMVSNPNPQIGFGVAFNAGGWRKLPPSRVWTEYSWLDPRDWWPFRDFKVQYNLPSNWKSYRIYTLTKRASNTYDKAKIDGGYYHDNQKILLTAGYRARIAGPYYWWENADAYAKELLVEVLL
jgi:hypothetical protein